MALIVLDGADEIDRVEVRTLREHLHISLIVGVDLRALEDLKANGTILVVGEERTSTRLSDVLDDATDTHRTVELLTQIGGIGLLALGIGTELLADELGNLCQLCLRGTGIEDTQILEGLFL